MLECNGDNLDLHVGDRRQGEMRTCRTAMWGQVRSASLDTKLWPVGSTGAFEHSFLIGANLLGGLDIKAMGGIQTFIQAMWGQVRSASLDTKLWPVASTGAFAHSSVTRST